VSVDGSNVTDIGCNCGTMITLNNDMVQEVKVQSANFSAEHGTGGMNVTAVTKGGSSQIHGTGYVDHVRDPAAGFYFSDNTKANFGKIVEPRGHRVIEFALKYYF
jgi:hypothetical protein